MTRPRCPWLLVFLAGTFLFGCRRGTETESKVYDLTGKVIALDSDAKSITLDHEDIPGLMKAMKMKLRVSDGTVLVGLKPGDQVKGRLQVGPEGYVIIELKKVP